MDLEGSLLTRHWRDKGEFDRQTRASAQKGREYDNVRDDSCACYVVELYAVVPISQCSHFAPRYICRLKVKSCESEDSLQLNVKCQNVIFVCICVRVCLCVCMCTHAVHAARICFTRPRFPPVEEASLSTNSRHTGDQLIPSQHQTRFKCVEKKSKVICEEKKDSARKKMEKEEKGNGCVWGGGGEGDK